MNKPIITALTACLLSASLYAAENGDSVRPLWLRNPAISPDGRSVAFTYKGGIYTVPSTGGEARRLTSDRSYNTRPVWTPDGSRIVFASDREGSDDIFIVDAGGGTPRRLTSFSGGETPLAFADSVHLLFSANIMPSASTMLNPGVSQVYSIDVTADSPRPAQWLPQPVGAVSVNASGDILYQDKKGYEDPLRKHERSSGTSDIWLIRDGKHSKLTIFEGHDLSPVWAAQPDSFYYLTERDGTLNVWSRSVEGTDTRQLTAYEKHPVRSLTASSDGTLAYSWDGEIYTLRPGAQPQRLDITIKSDLYDNDRVKQIRTYGASSMTAAPSGKEVAFIIRGDLYVTDTKYKTTKRVTNTQGQEREMNFSPDGRTLVYDSERDGKWKLFTTRIKDDKEKQFAYSTDLVEEPLYECATSAQQPKFSPDGKKVAFLENRTTLRVIDLKTKEVTTALDGKFNYSYTDGDISFEWSPDSRWLLVDYIGVGGWNNTDIALVAADGSQVVDLTESGYTDSNPKWALDGKAITYETAKYGMKSHGSWGNQSDIMIMVLDTDAWDNLRNNEEEAALRQKELDEAKEEEEKAKESDSDKAKVDKRVRRAKKNDKKKQAEAGNDDSPKPLEFDLDNRRYRMMRLTPASAFVGDYFLSPKGDKFYYVAVNTEGDEAVLYVRDLRKNETRPLVSGVNSGIVSDAKGENLFVFSGGGIKKISLPGGDTEAVTYEAVYERHPSKERAYIYDHMWKQVKDKFYDQNLHGVDWQAYGDHYRQFLPHISNNRDFAELMSEILGELNASHTGARAYGFGAPMSTAYLGAFFDENYNGDGLMVKEVLPRSPLATKKAHVKPGDKIVSIDGKPVKAGEDYFPLLEGLAGRKIYLGIQRRDGSLDRVQVKPITSGQNSDMLYQRWVERNEAMVDSLSGGRIGYVHVQGMDSPSFRTVYDRLLGKYRNREAVVVDTRWNGGGWLHNDIAQLLSGHEYVRFMPRGQYIGSEPFSQWNKPSVMLVNESNYSDAHGTPFVYQTLGIGDVVGAPVPGTMTAVWWETQIDPTIIFGIPQVTSMDLDGNVLENHQLNPDVLIYNNPGDVAAGYDAQLAGAVKCLLDKVGSKSTSK